MCDVVFLPERLSLVLPDKAKLRGNQKIVLLLRRELKEGTPMMIKTAIAVLNEFCKKEFFSFLSQCFNILTSLHTGGGGKGLLSGHLGKIKIEFV